MMKCRTEEAPPSVWEEEYKQNQAPWRSSGLSAIAAELIKRHSNGLRLIEIGCGVGDDAIGLMDAGYEYQGVDCSSSAIAQASTQHSVGRNLFTQADFFHWRSSTLFDIAYDKGLFHGLGGVPRRELFVRRVAHSLNAGGIWVTVCGSADYRREDFCHGAIYLRDLIDPAEVFFEVLEVVKAPYGLAASVNDFDAWHAVFRRR